MIPYKAEHLARIQSAPVAIPLTLAVARSLEGQYAWTAAVDGEVMGCAGFAQKWLDHWVAWAYLSVNSGPHMLAITRAIRGMRRVFPRGRIEAATACDFPAGHRWLRLIGFEQEATRMRSYTPDGRDFSLYSLVTAP